MSAVPTRDQLKEYPQLATIAALCAQLALIEPVLAAAHRDGEVSAPCEQARSMLRVVRILQSQMDAYQGLLAVAEPKGPTRPARPRN